MSTIIKAEVPIVPERIYGSPISLPSRSPQAVPDPTCASSQPASRQWAERQKLAPPPAPKELHPARVIDILVDLLHHPEDEARAVCQRLRAGGHPVTPEQIETIWAHYHLKKTPHVRSRHGRP